MVRNVLVALGLLALWAPPVWAHCDTMDGPVVKAGQQALDTGDLDYALIWIAPAAEAELRAAFKQALSVRKLGADARDLADRYFLETLVRLHRAGEGEPYTGIKPKGTDVGPAIPAADAAIATRSAKALEQLVGATMRDGLEQRLRRVLANRSHTLHDVAAGREYVAAYVRFMHYVERLYDDAASENAEHEHGAQ